MIKSHEKTVAAAVSVGSNTLLVISKLTIGWWIGSVSVISEAIHSGIDLLASLIALFAVSVAYKPADEDHPFGHGKFENISGTIEAILIFVAAGWILFEAIHKFKNPSQIDTPSLGVVVMLVSTALNFFVSKYLFLVGKRTDSIALMADGWHLRTDVYTSLGVMVGLGVITLGVKFAPEINWGIVDPIAAIFVSILILKAAFTLTVESGRDLLDMSLPAEQIAIIKKHIYELPQVKGFHKLRSRKSGPQRFIEFHLVMDPEMSLRDSHELTDILTNAIKKDLAPIHVTIHTEPCDHKCNPVCMEGCIMGKIEVEDIDKG